MKKIKLLKPIIASATIVTAGIPILLMNGCAHQDETKPETEKGSAELSKSVIEVGVTIKTFNIVLGEKSTIELNLPKGKLISSITIKIGDNTLSTNDVIISGGKITIPANKSISKKVIVFSIELKNIPEPGPEPEPETQVDFLTCDWAEIDTWCQSLELGEITEVEFCNHFLLDGQPFSSLDEFIGLTRTIKINGVDHVIRVVAVQHDIISDEDSELNEKKAILTFELETLLSDSNGNMIYSFWDSTGSNGNYLDSTLRANMGGGRGEKTWDRSAIQMLKDENDGTPSLAKAIKYTVHNVATSASWPSKQITQSYYVDKLYVPGYGNFTSAASEYAKDEYNTIYKYFADKELESEQAVQDARVKKDVNNNTCIYWLGSAYTNYGNSGWSVWPSGKLEYYTVTAQNKVAVTFNFSI